MSNSKVLQEDTSPKVYQKHKIKEKLNIREFRWTDKQMEFFDLAMQKETRMMICKGPPGSSKSMMALLCSLKKLNDKRISNIYYVRNPIESASRGVGYIKGELRAKMEWVIQPMEDQLTQLLSQADTNFLLNNGVIEGVPLGYMKGRTFQVSSLIIDEAEDLTLQEFELAFSRFGQFCKMFVIGDVRQSNIKNGGFSKVYDAFNTDEAKEHGIYTFEFTKEDCIRSPITQFIVETFETLR